jgi:hypothetical protein
VKKNKGHFVAHCPVFPVAPESASTQRGAIKKLRDAVLRCVRESAASGTLVTLLEEAGYPSDLIALDHVVLHPIIFDKMDVSLPLTRRMIRLNRNKRRATGEERNSNVA